MSDFKFNAFQIKRQAHAVSRSHAGLSSFNPFGHIWNTRASRNAAQPRLDVEDDEVEEGSPIEHSQTAPTGAYGAFGHDTDRRTAKDSRADLTDPDQERKREQERSDSFGDTVVTSQDPGSDFTAVDPATQRRHPARLEIDPVDSPDLGIPDEPKKKKEHRMFKNVQPKNRFTVANQIRRVFLGSWLNLLLFCVPVGISLGAVMGPSLETFFVNYAAVIPLYWLGDFAMTEIGLRTGPLISNYIGISTR